MNARYLLFCFSFLFLYACSDSKDSTNKQVEEIKQLEQRAADNMDRSKWDQEQFLKDKEIYSTYFEAFSSYPLNCSPFPVADYDYAVTSMPFSIESKVGLLKGISIGDFENLESEIPEYDCTLLLLTKGANYSEDVFVQSRNYPYLTAQGFFTSEQHHFDWVFMKSPDAVSFCFVNMKLFDLRFGETIILIPEEKKAFSYLQLKERPNDYESLEAYKDAIIKHERLEQWIK